MLNYFFAIYSYIFARKIFVLFNKFLYHISLRGLGIHNNQNSYLTGEKQWLSRYLKNLKNPLVIDVGANIGGYAKDVFEANISSFVYAFEPHPITFRKLNNNIANEKLKTFNLGLGNEKGKLELFDYKDNDGSAHASLYKEVITDLHRKGVVSHTVEVVKLDDFFMEYKIDTIDLLKIDTEGNEYNVLLGAEKYLTEKKIKAIHFEFNEMNIISKIYFKNFWDLLIGFEFYRMLPGGNLIRLKKYSPLSCEIYAFQNIVAILKK